MKRLWRKFLAAYFNDSETIFFARLQLVAGAGLELLAQTDLSPVLPPEWLPYWLIGSGILTGVLRKMRDPDIKGRF